ncbi:MAG: Tat (twin-arginine translocation) pathway signal sequence domain protein [Candidatus Solibacter sp.]|jgi:gluconate 2-dehydrogenase gamma chain|nr:Tat (twin-arginine translocation) pathway signal sequence domain protein [Candidatus Solibacter sp.]
MDVTRRNLIQILGMAPAAAAAQQAEHNHPAPAAPAPVKYQRKIFDDHQWRTVQVLCDLVIPADEHSGSATAAGVPEFIDDWLDFRKREDGVDNLSAQVLGGLTWLDQESTRLFQKDFAVASVDQQKQILDRIAWPAKAAREDRVWAAFFTRFRDLTVSGFFSSKMGVADLPYLGNRAVAEWKGTDPKVWAVIEERMKNGYKGLGGEVKPWTE